jgi:phytanoyl-CoA hydroxylase
VDLELDVDHLVLGAHEHFGDHHDPVSPVGGRTAVAWTEEPDVYKSRSMHATGYRKVNRMELELPTDGIPEPPLFRSRFGGLWTDRKDAHKVLEERRTRGEITGSEAESLAYYIDHGYVVFPGAVKDELIDDYLAFFESAWDDAPPTVVAFHQGRPQRLSRALYDGVAKVSCLHWYYPRANELIYPSVVLRFLTLLYDRPPVAFQTMSMRKGSEEPLHIDTGPLTLTEPMTMAASWLALEDVEPQSGEFQFVPGSHALPELLHHGTAKGHGGDMTEYGLILQSLQRMCIERGLRTERFAAKKGDLLIWHADLLHGGAPIEDMQRTRKSFIAHFMPLGVMPTFYDFSGVSAIPFSSGGYILDDYKITERAKPQPTTRLGALKARIPLPVRAAMRNRLDQARSAIQARLNH